MAIINNPNTKVSKTLLDSWIDVIQKATPKSTGGTSPDPRIADLGRHKSFLRKYGTELSKKIPSKGIMMKHPYLNALLSGYGIGTILDNQLGLSDMLAEALIQDPDMSGAKDMPSRLGGYEGNWRESYSKPEDYYEGETEATDEDLQKILQPMMQILRQSPKWK